MVLREHVLALAEALNVPENAMSTLAIPFGTGEDPKDPNHVKVVVDEKQECSVLLAFSDPIFTR